VNLCTVTVWDESDHVTPEGLSPHIWHLMSTAVANPRTCHLNPYAARHCESATPDGFYDVRLSHLN